MALGSYFMLFGHVVVALVCIINVWCLEFGMIDCVYRKTDEEGKTRRIGMRWDKDGTNRIYQTDFRLHRSHVF